MEEAEGTRRKRLLQLEKKDNRGRIQMEKIGENADYRKRQNKGH